MELVLYLDEEGLAKAEIVATEDEQEKAHRLWKKVEGEVKAFDAAVRRVLRGESAGRR